MRLAVVVALFASCQTGCGLFGSDDVPVSTLRVFAATSLTDALREVEQAFSKQHPHIDVQVVTAGSQVLRLQIEQGARADVFISANETHVRQLQQAGLVGDPLVVALNRLAVAVPSNAPASMKVFADLAEAERLVIGNANVPLGIYTRRLFDRIEAAGQRPLRAAVEVRVVSEESNARLVRTKVALGEADAAIVYRTDVIGQSGLREIPIPDRLNVTARYLMATVAGASTPEAIGRFRGFLQGAEGRRILSSQGFGLP